MEGMEESVWSIVRQGNEREDQWEGVDDSGKTGTARCSSSSTSSELCG